MTEDRPARSSRAAGLWIAGWLALGLGVRVAAALALRSSVAEWEADGFVRAWEGWSWGAWNRMRPPGVDWLLDQLGVLAGRGDQLALRLTCVAVSVVALACGWLLARAVVRRLGAPVEAGRRACCWLTAAWAFWPTLVATSPRPLGETAVGAAACLALAAIVSVRPTRWLSRLALLAAALGAFVVLGGVLAALALATGLIVFLLALPRLPVALLAVLAVCLALALGWRVQQGPDRSRRWEPDGAPVHGLAALLVLPYDPGRAPSVDPDFRAAHLRELTLERLREAGPVLTARALLARLLRDQSGPERLTDVAALAWPAAVLDAALRGAALLLALVALRRVAPVRGHGAGRAAVAVGLLAWITLLLLGATSPLALAPLDLVLAAAAAAGLAALPAESRPRTGLVVATGLAAALAVVLAARLGREPSDWSRTFGHDARQGASLVEMLRDGGPSGGIAELQAVGLLTHIGAPSLRLPEAARRHAEAAVLADPDSAETIMALVRTDIENLDLEAALGLVSTLVDEQGQLLPQAATMQTTLRELQRRLREERLP